MSIFQDIFRGQPVQKAVVCHDDFNNAQLIAVLKGTFINNYPDELIIEGAPRTYFDQDVLPDTTYYYWVQCIDGISQSSIKLRDNGYFTTQ